MRQEIQKLLYLLMFLSRTQNELPVSIVPAETGDLCCIQIYYKHLSKEKAQ